MRLPIIIGIKTHSILSKFYIISLSCHYACAWETKAGPRGPWTEECTKQGGEESGSDEPAITGNKQVAEQGSASPVTGTQCSPDQTKTQLALTGSPET